MKNALSDNPHTLQARARNIVCKPIPRATAHEEGGTVLPLIRLTVERAWRGGNREVYNCIPIVERS